MKKNKTSMHFRQYLLNCFLLVIPVLIWNVCLTGFLPQAYSAQVFWNNIPMQISVAENLLRAMVLLFPVLMPLLVKSKIQRLGLAIYVFGIVVYFLSWIMQIHYPESWWSKSVFGFLAPAYTTIIWLTGIGLIGSRLFIKIPFHPIVYILISILFVCFHAAHAYIIFARLYL